MKEQVSKTVFKNGIRIVSKKMIGVQSISIGIWVNIGSRYETVEENGLSHFIEHMLFRRTKSRVSSRLAKEIDSIGGQVNAFTTMEHTCYHAKVMSVHLATVVDILLDILLDFTFTEVGIKNERSVILQEIKSFENTPKAVVDLLLRNSLWENSPLGRPILGSIGNISRFLDSELFDFFHRYYNPNRILITAAGAVDHQKLVDLISPFLKKLDSYCDIVPIDVSCSSVGSTILVRDTSVMQAHICLGALAPTAIDSNRFAYYIMHTILGGNSSSRVFQRLRNCKGLAYSAYSFVLSYQEAGAFCMYATVDPDDVVLCVKAIKNILKFIMFEKVTYLELKTAKEYIKSNLILSTESTYSQIYRLAYNELRFGCDVSIQSDIASYDEVNVDDIMSIAHSLFSDNRLLSLVILSPLLYDKVFEDIL